MRKNKILATILTMALVAGNITYAKAENDINGTENNTEITESLACSMREPEVTVGDISVTEQYFGKARAASIDFSLYQDRDSVVETLRKGMVERESVITAYLVIGEFDSESFFGELYDDAVAVTENGDEGDYIRMTMGSCSMSASGVVDKSTYTYYLEVTFECSFYTTYEQEQELTAEVDRVIESFGFTESTSEYEKIRTIYDYICENVSGDYEHLEDTTYLLKHTAYAALMHKKAVCQGYASLFYRMLKDVGIENRYISGVSNNENHGWNIVKIGNLYYNADATWDNANKKSDMPYEYFLRSNANFSGHTRDKECNTEEFNLKHPMSDVDYSEGVNDETDSSNNKDEESNDEQSGEITSSDSNQEQSSEITSSGSNQEQSSEITSSGSNQEQNCEIPSDDISHEQNSGSEGNTEASGEENNDSEASGENVNNSEMSGEVEEKTEESIDTVADENKNTNAIKKIKVKRTKVKSVKKKKIKLKKIKGAYGYQIKYSTKRNMKKSKTVWTKKTTKKVKKLKTGKTYYIKARAYILVNGTKKYGKWSKVKKVKVK